MSRTGSTRDYRHSQKNHWRRTLWNEVLRRTAGRERSEMVLYLAGPQDNDRIVATQKGVPGASLFAIDRDRGNVRKIKDNGGLAVTSDALDLLWSWPSTRPVCAIVLDFCSGICSQNLAVYDALQRDPLRKAILAVNFQRGRDELAVEISDTLQGIGMLKPLWNFDPATGRSRLIWSDLKHRGYLFVAYHSMDTVTSLLGAGSAHTKDGDEVTIRWPTEADEERHAVMNLLFGQVLRSVDPKFLSYQSGTVVYDSVVINSPWRVAGEAGFAAFVGEETIKDHRDWVADRTARFRVPRVLHNIGAAFAVASRRGRS